MRISDWSSDVCSSDLEVFAVAQRAPSGGNLQPWQVTLLTGEPWQAVKDEVAARIAMGRGGQQPEYDISARELPDPWTDRRLARQSVGSGKSVTVRVDLGGCGILTKQQNTTILLTADYNNSK